MKYPMSVVLCLALTFVVGCDDDEKTTNTNVEAGVEAGTIAGAGVEAGTIAGAGVEAGTIAGAGVEAGVEAGTIAGAGVEAGVEAGTTGGMMPEVEIEPTDLIASGRFAPLAEAGQGIEGAAQLIRHITEGERSSRAQVYVHGLTPETAYNVHVHALPCAFNGGGHYLIDPSVEGVVEENEVWPRFTSNADGVGRADVSVEGLLRGDALSVVIHSPEDGSKISCADLLYSDEAAEFSGVIAPFPEGDAMDAMISGSASVMVGPRSAPSTTIELSLSGLTEGTEYKAHVHALPCSVSQGGGHYKLDPTVAETIAENEVWPSVVVADGQSNSTLEVAHSLRGDAQSIVIHRVTADGAPKVACADLIRKDYPAAVREGDTETWVLPAAAEQGVEGLTATASLTLNLDGSSALSLAVTGLSPEVSYNTHLHTDACEVNNGGGHYLIDPTLEGVLEENEIWPLFTTNAEGAAEVVVTADHLVRPEGQSVVIHGEAGARLACVPLY